jgi:hypothetical protein
VSCDPGHAERRAKLIAEHGKPRHVDEAAALRLIGERDQVHPHDVAAFAYQDHRAEQAWAASNLKHHGHPSLGSAIGGDAVIGVLDLRPECLRHGSVLISPHRPDHWLPPRRHGQARPRCSRCLDSGHVCEDHPYIAWEGCEDAGCGAAGMPCPSCCSPIPEGATVSITLAFTPDWQRTP